MDCVSSLEKKYPHYPSFMINWHSMHSGIRQDIYKMLDFQCHFGLPQANPLTKWTVAGLKLTHFSTEFIHEKLFPDPTVDGSQTHLEKPVGMVTKLWFPLVSSVFLQIFIMTSAGDSTFEICRPSIESIPWVYWSRTAKRPCAMPRNSCSLAVL